MIPGEVMPADGTITLKATVLNASSALALPSGLGVVGQYLVVIDDASDSVLHVLDRHDGTWMRSLGRRGRGPGEFFGTRQAGMPDLKVASLVKDAKLLEIAREEAFQIAAQDPALARPEHQLIKRILRDKWHTNLEMISIG